MRFGKVALATFVLCAACAAPQVLDFSSRGHAFEGFGALSGGGGVTRLLVDYPKAQQDDVLDALFLPGAGANLRFIKVEIGGDTQSTEGTEASHEHFRGDLNCSRGYEWWVVEQAKLRNPSIKTFGLSWGVPGWIGGGVYYSEDNIQYHVDWANCARDVHNFSLDYMGIWNERTPDADWTIALRAALDASGHTTTKIVYGDTSWSVADEVAANANLSAVVDVIGAHYPGTPSAAAYALGKPLWASEMWNLGQVNDWAGGAGGLLSDLYNQAREGMSASIVWCLVFSWFAILPFSRTTDSNAGLGHALTTAAEPWSGHWEVSPPIYALAHHNQFASPGWRYLSNSSGFGTLPSGKGSFVARFDPAAPAGPLHFSLVISNVGGDPTVAPFLLSQLPLGASLPASLEVWTTTQTAAMVRGTDIPVATDGSFSLSLPADCIMSITSVPASGSRGPPMPKAPIPASAPFPFPYADDFHGYAAEGYARYFSDEGGLFIVLPSGGATGGPALCNIVDEVPIVWEKNPSPYTLVGNMNTHGDLSPWTDYTVTSRGSFTPPPPPIPPAPSAGPHLITAACAAGGLQAFKIVSSSGDLATPSLIESVAMPGFCIGIDGKDPVKAGALAGALVPCNATGTSTAALTFLNGPFASQIGSVGTLAGLCLDVLGADVSPGARIVLWPCKSDGSTNEQWKVVPAGMSVSLVSKLSTPGLCVDALPPAPPSPVTTPTFLSISARISSYSRNGVPPNGYNFMLFASNATSVNGYWTLSFGGGAPLVRGDAGKRVVPGVGYTLALRVAGSDVSAWLDGIKLGAVVDTSASAGMVAIGSGWHRSCFEAFAVANNTA